MKHRNSGARAFLPNSCSLRTANIISVVERGLSLGCEHFDYTSYCVIFGLSTTVQLRLLENYPGMSEFPRTVLPSDYSIEVSGNYASIHVLVFSFGLPGLALTCIFFPGVIQRWF